MKQKYYLEMCPVVGYREINKKYKEAEKWQ